MLPATARRRVAMAAVGGVALVAIAFAATMNGASRTAAAAASIPRLALQPVAALPTLTALTARVGDSTLYVAQQQGVVRAVRNGKSLDPPVLDISDDVLAQGEQG